MVSMTHNEMYMYVSDKASLVGFSGYDIKIDKTWYDMEAFAEVNVDYLEKKINIKLNKGLKKANKSTLENILMHELLHGRKAMLDEQINVAYEAIKEDLEEQYINDITRGYIELMK